MKLFRNLLAFAIAASFLAVGALYAVDEQDGSRFDEELNERDFDALRDYLRSKRTLDIEESTSTLTISGDVRTEWRYMNEYTHGIRLRGHGVYINDRPVSRNDFDLEFNIRFDYITERGWASAHVRYDCSGGVDDNGHPCGPVGKDFDNDCPLTQSKNCVGDPAGYHGSGNCDDLCLKKAFFGHEIYSCGNDRAFFELGRRGNLYNVFDSNIQFLSRFDGLLLKYESSWDSVADWYVQGAGFLVDERVNHFAWVAETGFLNIADSGLDLKYSVIDWQKYGLNRCKVENPAGFRFLNSQFSVAYNLNPAWCGKPVRFYGAFLVNHNARKLIVDSFVTYVVIDDGAGNQIIAPKITERKNKKNLGWYAGVLIGKVRKEGDWAVEIQYQVVQAQAVPDGDCGGICRGNLLNESFTTCSRRGNTNFKGWKVQGLYAFTDNITVDTILEWTTAEDDRVGGSHRYSKFEMEAIYAF